MTRLLVIGDPHAVFEELDECQRLLYFAAKIAEEQSVDEIAILGDLNNTHNIVRVEVLNFWLGNLRILGRIAPTYVLVGNHDYAGEGSGLHSLAVYEGVPGVNIVASPMRSGCRLYLPYYTLENQPRFIEACCDSESAIAICHQSFSGAKLDNGVDAFDSIDPNLIPQKLVISGHIHTPQHIGKVINVGSPRWRSVDDANKDRSLRLFEIEKNGNVLSDIKFPTNTVCREIKRAIDTPDNPVVIPAGDNARWHIDIRGPEAWVEERKKAFSFSGDIRIRTFKTMKTTAKVRESEGVAVAFRKFLQSYIPQSVSIEVLEALVKERLNV